MYKGKIHVLLRDRPLTYRQFYAKLQLRAESQNPAFSPENLLRLYYHFGANLGVRTYSWTPKGVRVNVYKRAERANTKGI